ncbi:MAG: DUF723 domain-containing protein [Bacilli bacterium]|nr:DUF723 domain-containing protein [Bacilli bacterium]
MNTIEFINKAKLIHGEKYDYSKVEYNHSQEKVTIICPIHGEFNITPNAHLNGQGCRLCGIDKRSRSQSIKTEEFIKKAIEKHGDKYDYSLVDYINNKTNVIVICPIHGEFLVNPYKHINRGDGCPKCNKREKLTTETFINRSNELHNNFYDYSKVNYINYETKVTVICPIHGEFEISPNKHLRGQGCPKCRYIKSANGRRRTLEEVIEKANNVHNNIYDYSLITEYKNDRIKYPIICKEHGVFYQTMNNHICFKEGCPICGKLKSEESRKYTQEEWIEKANRVHLSKYNYSKVNYQGSNHKVVIICPIHGEFEQLPTNHLYGHGCPICKQSKLEFEIENFLIENNIEFEKQKTFDWLRNKRNLYLDFYIPKYNVAIECQGKQHFNAESFKGETYDIIIERDNKKKKLCDRNNIKLLYFSNLNIEYPYNVFENKEELLKEIINNG